MRRSVVALAGGVGGAKLAHGLYQVLEDGLTVVVNTGDDFEHWGLAICPDLDTVLYNLAGLSHPRQGWGLQGETFHALSMAQRYGAETWFQLGDKDLATHILRSQSLRSGMSLSQVTEALTRGLGVSATIVPMTDQAVRTLVHTDEGVLSFQDFFVRRRCEPIVLRLEYVGLEEAVPAQQALLALDSAAAVVLCPSNPYLSLDPILLLPGLAERIQALGIPVVAVSPIVGGRALKGPAAKIMVELGIEVSAAAVARHLAARIRLDGFVLDMADAQLADAVALLGIKPLVTDTIMTDESSKLRLGEEVLRFVWDTL